MITVREVKTRREQREFLNFPLDLYAGNPLFIPPLYADERKMFTSPTGRCRHYPSYPCAWSSCL